MTPDEYRAKWVLPESYPTVAANYAAKRSELAKGMGLGQTRKAAAKRAHKLNAERGRMKGTQTDRVIPPHSPASERSYDYLHRGSPLAPLASKS